MIMLNIKSSNIKIKICNAIYNFLQKPPLKKRGFFVCYLIFSSRPVEVSLKPR